MNKNTYLKIENYMLSCMKDSAHDKEHIYRVLNNALAIAKTESGVDYDVLIAACLLHDVGRPEQFADPSKCHALVGSEKAYAFLINNGFSEEFAEKVRLCIRTHRYRRADPPQSIEAKILFDADKLEVTGAIGIARTLVYKGIVSEPLYTVRADGSISNGVNDAEPSFFQEYKYKLEGIYGGFLTADGAKRAKERQQAAVDFYNRMYEEVNTSYESGKEELQRLVFSEE